MAPAPRRPDHYAWLLGCAVLFLLAACMAKCSSAETAPWPDPVPASLTYARDHGMPESLPVAVTIIRVNALGKEQDRQHALSTIKLEDWVHLHWLTVDTDATCYVEHGFVKLTIIYCGDIL